MTLVFVYGTLKRGFGNHPVMQRAGGNYVGRATRQFAKLVHLGGFPGLVESNDPDDVVHGELYTVPMDGVLGPLDRLEGYREAADDGMYLRRSRNVMLEDGTEQLATLYVWNGAYHGLPEIEDGNYTR